MRQLSASALLLLLLSPSSSLALVSDRYDDLDECPRYSAEEVG